MRSSNLIWELLYLSLSLSDASDHKMYVDFRCSPHLHSPLAPGGIRSIRHTLGKGVVHLMVQKYGKSVCFIFWWLSILF